MTLMLIDLALLLLLLFTGIPLPFCFGGALVFMVVFGKLNFLSLMIWGTTQMVSFTLLAGPLFILAGKFINECGAAEKLLDIFKIFIGKLKGGIGVVAVVCCGFLGAISGSSFTGIAAVAPSLHPRMVKEGYPKGYAASLLCSATVLGQLIPPSVSMITFGWVTGVSVLAGFVSTVIPGLILIILLSVINLFDAKKFCRPENTESFQSEIPAGRKGNLHTIITGIPALLLPVIILGFIYGGVCTATEVAAIVVLLSILIGLFVYRTMTPRKVLIQFKTASSSVGGIMMLIFFCLLLSQSYVLLKLPDKLVHLLMGFTSSKIVLLLMVNVFLVFMGMITNDTTAIVLCAPLLLPICSAYGISGVQLGALMITNLAFGGITPPYASILYYGMKQCDCNFGEIMKPTLKFLVLAFLPLVLLVTFIPALSEWLPTVMGLM